MSENSFDFTKSSNSFEDVISVYYALRSLGYSDEQLCDIAGFLHDALNHYLMISKRTES